MDGLTDQRAHGWADGPTDPCMDLWTHGRTNGPMDWPVDGPTDRQTDRQTDEWQMVGQTDRQTDRRVDRQKWKWMVVSRLTISICNPSQPLCWEALKREKREVTLTNSFFSLFCFTSTKKASSRETFTKNDRLCRTVKTREILVAISWGVIDGYLISRIRR